MSILTLKLRPSSIGALLLVAATASCAAHPAGAPTNSGDRNRETRDVHRPDPHRPQTTAGGHASLQSPSSAAPSVIGTNGFFAAPPVSKPQNNPLAGYTLWVNPQSQAALQASAQKRRAPDSAALVQKIAAQPSGVWLGEWSGDVQAYTSRIVAAARGHLPVFVLYNLPFRDCGQHSAGGLREAREYRAWVRSLAAGVGSAPAAFVIEPDALGLLDKCLTTEQQKQRLALIKDAIRVLRKNPTAAVYVDAGHARWVKPELMAERLLAAGVGDAHGFALNTSNYVSTKENLRYGEAISALTGGKHFVVDTGRNGNGAAPNDEWCNPAGRKLGAVPSSSTGHALADAWLWIKPPGESDGECNGGPKAGQFWLEKALELAR